MAKLGGVISYYAAITKLEACYLAVNSYTFGDCITGTNNCFVVVNSCSVCVLAKLGPGERVKVSCIIQRCNRAELPSYWECIIHMSGSCFPEGLFFKFGCHDCWLLNYAPDPIWIAKYVKSQFPE